MVKMAVVHLLKLTNIDLKQNQSGKKIDFPHCAVNLVYIRLQLLVYNFRNKWAPMKYILLHNQWCVKML